MSVPLHDAELSGRSDRTARGPLSAASFNGPPSPVERRAFPFPASVVIFPAIQIDNPNAVPGDVRDV